MTFAERTVAFLFMLVFTIAVRGWGLSLPDLMLTFYSLRNVVVMWCGLQEVSRSLGEMSSILTAVSFHSPETGRAGGCKTWLPLALCISCLPSVFCHELPSAQPSAAPCHGLPSMQSHLMKDPCKLPSFKYPRITRVRHQLLCLAMF